MMMAFEVRLGANPLSRYETYDNTCMHYDQTRVPVGIEIILGCLATGPAVLHEVELLDGGCGTGAYAAALIDHLGHMEAVDLSQGMLSVARRKLASYAGQGKIAFHRADITALPFPDAHFDGVCFNQVLHHLDTEEDDGFPKLRTVLAEAYRVLRPGGVLVVNTCSQDQLAQAHWYCQLIPNALERLRRRYVPLDRFQEFMVETGFTFHSRIVPLDACFMGAQYFDPQGPLRSEWRDGDSFWSLATPEQVGAACERIRDLSRRGQLESHFHRLDASRPRLGQVTFLHASRRSR